MSHEVTWTLISDDVEILVTATDKGDGSVDFNIELLSGTADLTGFFIDFFNDGGSIDSLGGGNNMQGAGDGFDFAEAIGTSAGNDADTTSATVTISRDDLNAFGVTELEQLALAEVGIRTHSVGDEREDSLKLTAVGELHEDEEENDDFPLWDQNISNIILVFDQELGDTKPSPDGDGYYTVKIDNWPGSADNDLDNSIDAILDYLIVNDVNIGSDENLLGVIIKGGNVDTDFYAYGDNDTSNPSTDPDPAPSGLGLSWDGSANPQPANAVDTSYNYDAIFA